MLTVAEYDALEQEAKIGLSFCELMAFAPRTFEDLGFPHRVADDRELVRYADWNRNAETRCMVMTVNCIKRSVYV